MKKRLSRTPIAGMVGTIVCLCHCCEHRLLANEGNANIIQQIGNKWKSRENKFRSGRLIWNVHHTFVRGSISLNDPQLPVLPPEDLSFEAPLSLLFDGDKTKYSAKWKLWRNKENDLVDYEIIRGFDGERSLEYVPTPEARGYPAGVIRSPKTVTPYLFDQVLPLTLTIRPFMLERRGFQIGNSTILNTKAIVDDDVCYIIQNRPESTNEKTVAVWVNPTKDFAIVGYAEMLKNVVLFKIDIDYSNNPKFGWIPKQWRINKLNRDGSVRETSRGTVADLVYNLDFPASEFQISFPSGTLVEDQTTDSKNNPPNYIVKDDGKRLILPEEYGESYHDILTSETGEAGKRPPSKFVSTSVFAFVVLSLLGGYFVWKYRKRSGCQSPL